MVRELAGSGAVDVIPTTSSHSWLPSVAEDPVVARAQVRLAAADHAGRLGMRPSGIWLPFLGYRPGLESVMGEAGLRFFGVGSDEFLRGTILPPAQDLRAAGHAAGRGRLRSQSRARSPGCRPGHGLRPRPEIPRFGECRRSRGRPRSTFLDGLARLRRRAGLESPKALPDRSRSFIWPPTTWPVTGRPGVAWRGWSRSSQQMSAMDGPVPVSLGGYLDRNPAGVLGRPGPSAGGILSARPGGSDLFDRCRAAADLLTFAVEHRSGFSALHRRCVAHMTRSLLRAQQVDWSLPPGHGIDADDGTQPRPGPPRPVLSACRLAHGRPPRSLACSTTSTAVRPTCPRSTWSCCADERSGVAVNPGQSTTSPMTIRKNQATGQVTSTATAAT